MNAPRRTRRLVGVGAIALASALAVSACSGGGPAPDATPTLSDEPVTLRFAWWGNDDRAQKTIAAVRAFEEEYPNITIETESADFGPYFDRLGTQVSAGDAPDVFQINDNSLATFVTNGTLMDLSTLDIDTSEIPDAVLETNRIDGMLAGMPMGVSPWGVIIVNTELVEQSGVTLPDDKTWTWEQYAETGAKIKAALGDGFDGIDSFAFESFNLVSWAQDHGEDVFNADGTVAISPEVLAGYWQFVLDLHDSGTAMPATQYIEAWNTGVSARPSFLGTAAMTMAGTTWVARISTAAGVDMELLRGPSDGEGSMFNKSSMAWAISSKTEHPAEAALFVDWLTNSGTSYEYLGFDRGLPANSRVLQEVAPSLTLGDKIQVEFSDAVASEVTRAYIPPPPGAGALSGLMTRFGEQVLLHLLTPEAAADAMIKELQVELDRAA